MQIAGLTLPDWVSGTTVLGTLLLTLFFEGAYWESRLKTTNGKRIAWGTLLTVIAIIWLMTAVIGLKDPRNGAAFLLNEVGFLLFCASTHVGLLWIQNHGAGIHWMKPEKRRNRRTSNYPVTTRP